MGSGSITEFVNLAKDGDSQATAEIWQRYSERLFHVASKRLGWKNRRVEDANDVLQKAFISFFSGIRQDQFGKVGSRDALWRILVTITLRKTINQINFWIAEKRGGGEVRGLSVFTKAGGESTSLNLADKVEATPTEDFMKQLFFEFSEVLEEKVGRLEGRLLTEIAELRLQGHSTKEIATHIGKSENTVRRKLDRIQGIWEADTGGE